MAEYLSEMNAGYSNLNIDWRWPSTYSNIYMPSAEFEGTEIALSMGMLLCNRTKYLRAEVSSVRGIQDKWNPIGLYLVCFIEVIHKRNCTKAISKRFKKRYILDVDYFKRE